MNDYDKGCPHKDICLDYGKICSKCGRCPNEEGSNRVKI